jgi:hypothetical protein
VLPTPSDIFVVVGGGFTAALRVHRIASHRIAWPGVTEMHARTHTAKKGSGTFNPRARVVAVPRVFPVEKRNKKVSSDSSKTNKRKEKTPPAQSP